MAENHPTDAESNPQPSEITLEEIAPIYQTISEDNRVYNNIVWQFPTALIAANGLLLQAFQNSPPYYMLVISILNFALIHALFKLGHNQHAIIMALQRTEVRIKKIQDSRFREFLPDYKSGQPKLLGISSRNLINYLLLAANSIYFVATLILTLKMLFTGSI
ncbi:MAG: hypothetical protein AB9897_03115 [Anaerolineaceae bacterium]